MSMDYDYSIAHIDYRESRFYYAGDTAYVISSMPMNWVGRMSSFRLVQIFNPRSHSETRGVVRNCPPIVR